MIKSIKLYALCSFLLCAACTPVHLPNMHSFTLSSIPVVIKPATTTKFSLFVSLPNAAPGFDRQEMAYMQQPFQIEYFTKNQWVAPPAHLLLPLLTQTLQNTHHYRAIIASPSSGLTDFRLDTSLIELTYSQLNQQQELHMKIYAQLMSNHSQQVIATKTFATSVPVREQKPAAIVASANQATSVLLKEISEFCVKNTVIAQMGA